MAVYGIYGTYRVEIKADSENEALEKFGEMKVDDLSRVDINDIVEF